MEQQQSSIYPLVYLSDIDPTIVQSVRYATAENFTAHPVCGYRSAKIILARETAYALKSIQESMRSDGYSLLVYDGYRPQSAVDSFFDWSQDANDERAKSLYYPTIDKAHVYDLGYVARRCGHSRGGTVDLTLIAADSCLLHPPIVSHRRLHNSEQMIPFIDDGSLDMGSSWDLFHDVSHHDTPLVSAKASANRDLLRRAMKQNGFREYDKEWWHYTFVNEPYPSTYFNFDVE